MEIRECKPEDIIALLQCAEQDENMYTLDMFDDWEQYQRWLLDAVYNQQWEILIADDGFDVVGFMIWNLHQNLCKYEAYVNYVYINKDNRDTGVGDEFILRFIINSYNSSAQRWAWSSKVLPDYWTERVTLLPPHDKYTTYNVMRSDELKEWYDKTIKPLEELL